MSLRRHSGILVGRPAQGRLTYNWGVVPNAPDPDVLECELPKELFAETMLVNAKRARRLLTHFYIVEYTRQDVPSLRGGVASYLSLAHISSVKERIPLESLPSEAKRVDPLAEVTEFKEEVEIDEKFLLDLSNTLGTGAKLPKRFYSTPVVLRVKEGEAVRAVMMPFAEVVAFLQDNPGYVKGLLVLPSYHFGVILTEDVIPIEVFKEAVLDQVLASWQTFKRMLEAVRFFEARAAGEVEE